LGAGCFIFEDTLEAGRRRSLKSAVREGVAGAEVLVVLGAFNEMLLNIMSNRLSSSSLSESE
jgi:hypothetical protein